MSKQRVGRIGYPARPDHSVSDRLTSAVVSLLVSLPVSGLLWLIAKLDLPHTQSLHSFYTYFWLVGLLALFAFCLPRLFDAIFGWLGDGAAALLRQLGKEADDSWL